MSKTDFLFDGPDDGGLTVILAHGAGAPMDSPFMARFAALLGNSGYRVARFEFPYMARRRAEGGRRPPDRQPILLESWRAAVSALDGGDKVAIGGKSMGGRMASMIADEAGARGLVCIGYPFHPPGKPESLRTAHLTTLKTPTLILQGERDPFGGRDEVAGYDLSPQIRLAWLPDGDHDLKPRKKSGFTADGNMTAAVDATAGFLAEL
ncbi:MAG: dienelactone hydrolase family protein [Minwuiales bacterium]|nr:dienelactone hydrolase family protein [Minwuiales bacterium]